MGIEFAGDPHIRRLISSYFDPNLYCAILGLPLIISISSYKRYHDTKSALLIVFILVSALFTVSRSGIASLILILGIYGSIRLFTIRLNRAAIIGSVAAAVAVVASYPLYSTAFDRMVSRFGTNMSTDASSLNRIYQAESAFKLINAHPLFGVGYNYVQAVDIDHYSYDQSLLSLIAMLGFVGGLIFFSLHFLFAFRSLSSLTRLNAILSAKGDDLVLLLTIYILVSVVFASLFNNLLFYQFWYIPVFVAIFYFYYAFTFEYEKTSEGK
nr:O-antigen ligase family protein [Rhizomicrobium palustre]